ncbi:hypothetical protein CSUB_C0874 [Candidatus Caldarchaeum subterraneum]|uniref:Uncharacterized protein n=1 Tax=Caldiarchaeum subterraneum TaxID=311458 RepID=E6N6C2_CALS0|nr:hypothetical protein HGMM_F35E02C04 [Candidatus Caldarchaeum subterraneum]BAJ47922.1 hypothetical protein HGMM_F33G03C34 [Candidatus Caldarchaeum subterraneum]BAJ50731.1 hypothetical protein CSUB_C0874 [Candidatus Caldarchaeum subterraneum]
MRAQLAVSSLIIFGIILVGLGFAGLPYVITYDETVAIQTSSVTTVVETDAIVRTTTMELTEAFETSVVSTTLSTETAVTTNTLRHVAAEVVNQTVTAEAALVTGPITVQPSRTLELSWKSNKTIDIYIAVGSYLNASSWRLVGRGVVGSAATPFNDEAEIYVITRTDGAAASVSVTVVETWPETTTETKTSTLSTSLITTFTSTRYLTSETTYTASYTTEKPVYYVTTLVTTVTETRYPDLSFMTLMGSFIIFVGILFMVLLLRTLGKPVEKP